MSCEACNGWGCCPVCSPEPDMMTCPDCNGDGVIYIATDLEEEEDFQTDEQTYMALPYCEDEALRLGQRYCRYEHGECRTCEGYGEVVDEWAAYDADRYPYRRIF